MTEAKKVSLVLEDGTRFEGPYLSDMKNRLLARVVFYTAMTGYPESLTDPSYTGQILVSTFPLIGNYGVPSDELKNNINEFYESNKVHH